MTGEIGQFLWVILRCWVGWIEEDQIGLVGGGGGGFDPVEDVGGDHYRAIGDREQADVFPQAVEGGAVGFEEDGRFRAAAEAFQSKAAGAGEAIVNHGVADSRGEDVENGLLRPIGDGAG